MKPSASFVSRAEVAPVAPTGGRRPWIDHWLETVRDLKDLKASHPMMDAVIDEIDGRMIRIGDHWLADFASCNYLGFDLDRRSWPPSRAISRRGGPTRRSTTAARSPARGAAVRRFRFEDPDHLDELLAAERDPTRLVVMDGVNSMTGNAPDLPAFAAVARRHGALLYVDDVHGFGVIGERAEDETSPYGSRGNSVVRHTGETYENLVLVGGFSKAYSSLLAFIACPTEVKDLLKVAARPYLCSGPSPVASLATVLAGFDVNERRGDEVRRTLFELTDPVLGALARLDVVTPNHSGFPIVEVPLRDHRRIADVGRFLFDHGVYVTLAAFPLVPKDEVGLRLQVTAANTVEEVDRAIVAIEELAAHGELKLRSDDPERLDWAA